MRKLFVALTMLLWASSAQAAVYMVVFAGSRGDTSGSNYHCVKGNLGDGDLEHLWRDPATEIPVDQSECEAAGYFWQNEYEAFRYRKGDVLQISKVPIVASQMCEQNPPAVGGKFVCIEVTDKTWEAAKSYNARHLNADRVQVGRARFYINYSAIPQGVIDELTNVGFKSGTWDQLKPLLYDRETGGPVP